MTTSDAPTGQSDRATTPGAEQLTLLDTAEVSRLKTSNAHARFRLSAATRRRGLQHVAEIRQQLAAAGRQSTDDNVRRLPPRRPEAA